ncbi:MAG: M48 family metallopeptidase [Oscillatoriales cyanobacterium RM1_1_9]|nr:M48 family metallopeptidase [Oscillatoriales cyanobacterium RM1_1_9]
MTRLKSLKSCRKKQKWLKSAEDRIAQHREFFVADSSTRLPEALFLQSMGEQWTIQYQGTLSSRVSIAFQSNSRLIVRGFIEDETACQLALKRWIMGRAQECLVSWLQKLSEIHGLSFEKAVVRGQKTCWASCSHRKTISLNYKLLFLPPHLVHYVLIHELSHTVHLNHSRQFWGFVGTLEPDYKAADQELKEAWRYVPPWIERL